MVKTISKTGTKLFKSISPTQAIEIFKIYAETKANKEKNKILRKNIEAIKEVELEKIKTQKEVLLMYFEEIFKERRKIYEKHFELLDKGIASQNIEMIQLACSSIVTLAKETPLKELEKFRMENEIGKEIKKLDNFEI